MQYPWRICLFGGPILERPNEPPIARFRSQKVAALLGYLATFPHRAHTREELACLFWPDASDEDSRRSLRVALTSLRHQLEPAGTIMGSVLVADRQQIRLNQAAFVTDVADFLDAVKRKDYTTARQLASGPLLPGCYDEWALAERYRLEEIVAGLPEGSAPSAPVPPTPNPTAPFPVQLPRPLTRFFGREQERERLAQLLLNPQNRCVTLIGPGGNGKTRLAIEVAWHVAEGEWGGKSGVRQRFEAGIYFIPLADCRDATEIPERIARVLGVPKQTDIATFLGDKACLLILDNLEQIAEASAIEIERLLTQVPNLTLLLTSRQRLSVPGEHLIAVPMLAVPEKEDGDVLSLLDSPAIRLFIDRAQSIVPDFALTRHNTSAIATFCRALEGAPLAIELSAAWVQTLTPAQMTEKIHEKFVWIRARHEKDREARHQSLAATIAWSVDLLPPTLQKIFFSLSVFRGSFTAEAAQTITGATLDDLARLRERSLLQNDLTSSDTIRWRLLETIRDFASESLCEPEVMGNAHLAYYADLAKNAYETQYVNAQQSFLLLEREHDNLRACFDYAICTNPTMALMLATSLQPFWEAHGYLDEGIDRVQRGLERLTDTSHSTELHVRSFMSLGVLYMRKREYEKALEYSEKSLVIAKENKYAELIGKIQHNIGLIASSQNDLTCAESYLIQSIESTQDLHSKNMCLNSLGNLRLKQKRHHEAFEILFKVVQAFRDFQDDRNLIYALNCFAAAVENTQGLKEAMPYYYESLATSRRLGNVLNAYSILINLAQIAVEVEEYSNAARLYGLVDAVWEQIRVPRSKTSQARYDKDIPLLRTELGANFDQHYQTGRKDDWRLYP
jgi:predicted ATPase